MIEWTLVIYVIMTTGSSFALALATSGVPVPHFKSFASCRNAGEQAKLDLSGSSTKILFTCVEQK